MVGLMANSTKTKAGRAAARARMLDAERAARERLRLNTEDLALVFSARERAEKVGEWVEAEVEKVKARAAAKRSGEERAAGAALQAMRDRGMSVKDLAAMADLAGAEVQRLMRLAAEPPAASNAAPQTAEESAAGGGVATEPGPPGVEPVGRADDQAATSS